MVSDDVGVLVTVGGGLCAVSDDRAGWFCCGVASIVASDVSGGGPPDKYLDDVRCGGPVADLTWWRCHDAAFVFFFPHDDHGGCGDGGPVGSCWRYRLGIRGHTDQ